MHKRAHGVVSMPNYVQNYIAIQGDQEQIAEFKRQSLTRVEIPFEWNNKRIDYVYKFDLDTLIPMPQELRETGAPTRVFDSQEEVDEANATYSVVPLQEDARYIAITRDEALRRTMKYGKTLEQQLGFEDSEFGILNGHDWAAANQTSKWRYLHTEVIQEEPGLLVFVVESAWQPPAELYNRLVALGFKVSWAWQGEEDDQYGRIGEYFSQWKRRIVWDFRPEEAWYTVDELGERVKERFSIMRRNREAKTRSQEITKRRSWAEWFRDRPDEWQIWFPGYDMEEWIQKVAQEELEIPTD